jgi:hypothetical protein
VTLRTFVDRLLRVRYLLMLALSGGCFAVWYSSRPLDGDWWVFEYGARVIGHLHGDKYQQLAGGWPHVYATMPKLQVGPPALLLAIPSQLLTPATGRLVMAIVLTLSGVALVAVLERLARQARPGDRSVTGMATVGGLLLVPAWDVVAVRYMHLDDALVLGLLVSATWAAQRQRWIALAVVLGTAIAIKPWALAFIVLIAVLPRRDVVRAAAVTFVAAIIWWLPFVIADHHTIGSLWNADSAFSTSSTPALLGLTHAPTGARGLQFALMLLGAFVAVRYGRWMAAPLIAVAIRLVTDWQTWGYYGAGLVVAALLFDLLGRQGHWPLVTVAAFSAAGAPAWLATIDSTAAAITRLVLVTFACALAWRAIQPTTTAPADATGPTLNVLEYST